MQLTLILEQPATNCQTEALYILQDRSTEKAPLSPLKAYERNTKTNKQVYHLVRSLTSTKTLTKLISLYEA
jgi:uncharacterized membrane protein